MSEELNAQQPNSTQGQPASPAVAQNTDTSPTAIPYDRFKQKVDEANALKARLDELEAKERQRAQAEMSEVDRLKAQLSELEPIKQQAHTYSQVIEQVLQRELESVPEDKRGLIQGDTPAAKLQDLTRLKALGLFVQQPAKPTPPNINAGEGAGTDGTQYSSELIEMSNLTGIPVAKLAAQKQAIENRKKQG